MGRPGPFLYNEAVPQELLTIEELRELLHCSRGTIYKLIDEKKLPHLKIGKRVLFRREDVDRLIERELKK